MIAERIPLPGGEVELMRPPDAEALISEESFEHEEFLPYWAELWASAVALAHDVSIRSLRGRRTLELGCGLGLPSIAAARAGGRVLATDWSSDAVRATAANAERNEVDVETLRCAWGEPDAIVARAPWQLVIASRRALRAPQRRRSCSTCFRASWTSAAWCCSPIPAVPTQRASWRGPPSRAGSFAARRARGPSECSIHRMRRS